MKILISGHKGFVGRHFLKKLKSRKNFITGIDKQDGNDCRNFFKSNTKTKFDLVIHLAAIIGGKQKTEEDPMSVAMNLAIDSEMFNWAVRSKPKKIIYFSSSAAYPVKLQKKGKKTPLRERDIDLDNIESPDQAYGWVKLSGEILAKYASAYGIDVLVLRPFSVYGEDQNLFFPFPSFIDMAVRKKDPFEIWGDGTQIRDFIHIDDIVDCSLAAINDGIEGPLNLGTGIPTSLNKLAKMIFKISGFHPKIKHLIDKPKGMHYKCSNNKKMLSFYTPKISLEEGVKNALEYRKLNKIISTSYYFPNPKKNH